MSLLPSTPGSFSCEQPTLGLDLQRDALVAAFRRGHRVRILSLAGPPFDGLLTRDDPLGAFATTRSALAREGFEEIEVTTLAVPLDLSPGRWRVLQAAARQAGLGHLRIMTAPVAVALGQLYWRPEAGDLDLALFDLAADQVAWGLFRQEEGLTETLALHLHAGKQAFPEVLAAHRQRLLALSRIVLLARSGEPGHWEAVARQTLGGDGPPLQTLGADASASLAASGALVQSAILAGRIKGRVVLDATCYRFRLAAAGEATWSVCPACGPRQENTGDDFHRCGKTTTREVVYFPSSNTTGEGRWVDLVSSDSSLPLRKSCVILARPGGERATLAGVTLAGETFVTRTVPLPGRGERLVELTVDIDTDHEAQVGVALYRQSERIFSRIFPNLPVGPSLEPLGEIPPGVRVQGEDFLEFREEPSWPATGVLLTTEEIEVIVAGLGEG